MFLVLNCSKATYLGNFYVFLLSIPVNFDNKVGAVGFVPRLLESIYPTTLIRVDEVTGKPIRDPETGLVIKCKPGEAGEIIGRIDNTLPTREFSG